MAEKSQAEDDAVEAEAPLETNGVAVAVALDEARANPELKEDVQAFLREQISLIGIQKHHLHEQFKQLKVKHLGERLKVLTMAFGAIAGALVLGGLGWMAWTAHNDHSLTIAAFSAPPDFAERGLTGEELAAQLQDRLLQLQLDTRNNDQAARIREAGAADIKLNLPETGISIAELQRLFDERFGHATLVRGSIAHGAATEAGAPLVLTVRAGEEPGARLEQADGDVDALLQKGAEQVYEMVDPVRFARWLGQHGRAAEASDLLQRTTRTGSVETRADAYLVLAQQEPLSGRWRSLLDISLRLAPHRAAAWMILARDEQNVGRSEIGLAHNRRAEQELRGNPGVGDAQIVEQGTARDGARGVGAYLDDLATWCVEFHVSPCATDVLVESARTMTPDSARTNAGVGSVTGFTRPIALAHDTQSAAQHLSRNPDVASTSMVAAMRADWPGALEALKVYDDAVAAGKYSSGPSYAEPDRAIALAETGQLDAAEAVIGRTPLDCYFCVITRAQVAEIHGDRGRADRWFAQALAQGPSIPMAEAAWGQVLLGRGQPDAAIPRFASANRKGPHFADPLELWGEALMAKGDYRGAAAKFEQANKYAPRWGRLHLMWSQALAKSGDADGAKRHDFIAHSLDLTPPVPIFEH